MLLASAMFLSLPGQAWMAEAPPQDEQLQQASEVHFQDQKFESTVRWQLHKNDDEPVTKEDMASLTELSLIGVNHVEGLQYATNLTQLNVSRGELQDIGVLRSLTKLTKLDLGGNQIEDLSPLRTLTNLETLNLNSNKIADLGPLGALTKLKELNLSGNPITDLSPLQPLTNLEKLYLSGTIKDIGPLAAMTKLKELNLQSTQFKALSQLRPLANLERLDLNNNGIADIEPLSALTKLTNLNLSDNQIADLSPLKPLTHLQTLYISKNQIVDLRPLAGMTQMRSLYAGNNQIKDLAPLKQMTQLVDLNLPSNLIYDLGPLASVKNISYLNLSYNRIWNLEPIRNHAFAHYYDTGALIYGLNFAGNYLDLRRTSRSYKILEALDQMDSPASTTPINKVERLVIGSTTAYIWESPFKLTHAPFIVSDRTYVPIRFVSKWLGAEVGWDQTKKEVTIRKGNQTIRWIVNEKNADVNGQTVPYDVPMLLKNNSAFVPVRFVSEQLESSVEYMTNPKTVLIFEKK
ncbi:leucine-rich repeat domain-containing protein [Cohnella sp. OV330]|uniref:leucine-rich repeat domain-containing protein n=1 Tax=Cohnella sp. OV330 TaxID=1855288 RepID=UPI000AFC89C5|nr:leucine-rich repeat domain-containing protein [Cohnella sp. OV330]